jgi:hypothetical protein
LRVVHARDGRPGVSVIFPPAAPFFIILLGNTSMPLKELHLRLISIGESADRLCRVLSANHRLSMHLRDLSTQVAIGMLQLSDEARKRIASN